MNVKKQKLKQKIIELKQKQIDINAKYAIQKQKLLDEAKKKMNRNVTI